MGVTGIVAKLSTCQLTDEVFISGVMNKWGKTCGYGSLSAGRGHSRRLTLLPDPTLYLHNQCRVAIKLRALCIAPLP